MIIKKKLKIALIYGGISSEREISFNSAKYINKHLNRNKYSVRFYDVKFDLLKLIQEGQYKEFDLAFIALHGKFGEDGKIQSILDILKIPYTGSGVLASALCMNKIKTFEFLKNYNIKTPEFLPIYNKNIDLEKIKYPCIVKPNENGSSIGITIVNSFEDLKNAVKKAFSEDTSILIEEYIRGIEITCGVLGNSKQTKLMVLPPVQIIPGNNFFDYDAKYFSKQTQEICPADIPENLTKKVQELSKKIHDVLGCDGLTRSDFILKDNEFYFLEINTIPGLTEVSLCPKEAKAIGISFEKFLDMQIGLAIKKSNK